MEILTIATCFRKHRADHGRSARAAASALAAVLLAGCAMQAPAPDEPQPGAAAREAVQESRQPGGSAAAEDAEGAPQRLPVEAAATTSAVAAQAPPDGLLSRLQALLRLDHRLADRPAVRRRLHRYAEHPQMLGSRRAALLRYLPHLCGAVQRRDMPGELCLLPLAESGLGPRALSRDGAAGLWQFMPNTARSYGLRIDPWVDERLDPLLATDAALDYLADLHAHFDDWLLALAAYNAGRGRVQSAVARQRTRDVYELELPRETLGLVDKVLALGAAFSNPDRFGIALPIAADDPWRESIAEVVVPGSGQVHLLRAAQALERDASVLAARNPALIRRMTHPDGPHRLLVDAADAQRAQAAMARIATSRGRSGSGAWQTIRIARNDTLSELALRYGTDVATLRAVNNLPDTRIRAGDPLLVPAATDAGK